jgi:hypothetical protein
MNIDHTLYAVHALRWLFLILLGLGALNLWFRHLRGGR